MTETEAIENLQGGTAILDAVLAPCGFSRGPISFGRSSGGSFASCEFRRGSRSLQLHFRYSLGLVEYQLDGANLSHEDYMWSVCGKRWATHYPGFSEEPLDAFRHLAADLEQYGRDFLRGSDEAFIRHLDRAAALKRGVLRLPE
jgi:hypothetical protein